MRPNSYRHISPREDENVYPENGDLLNFDENEIETHPLPTSSKSGTKGSRCSVFGRILLGVSVLCLALFGFSYAVYSSKSKTSSNSNDSLENSDLSMLDSNMNVDTYTATNGTYSKIFKISNKYIARDGPLGGNYPWLEGRQLAEPYYDTTFTVVTPSVSDYLKKNINLPVSNTNINHKRNLKLHIVGKTSASKFNKDEDLKAILEEDRKYKETHFHNKGKHEDEIMRERASSGSYIDNNHATNKTYVWTIDDTKYTGLSVTHNFEEPGIYSILLEELDGDQLLTSYSEDIVIKYVRRELRSLTESDADLFFETAKTMWDVSSEEGKIKYGNNFKNIEYFTSLHGDLAGAKDCDHIHDGMAFVPFHVAISMKFEKSLQAINPQVSLPYWDYSIDFENIASDYNGTYSESWFESEVWKSNWFGKIDTENNLNYVTEGRWAYTEMLGGGNNGMKYSSDDYVHNSYGYLRAPWNQNPSKYITRSSTSCGANYDEKIMGTSDCNVHYQLVFNSQYSSFESFSWFIPGPAHGPVHMLTGGISGCSEDYDSLLDEGFSEEHVNKLKFTAFISRKNFYRSGYLSCPETCDVDSDSTCTCSCPNLESDIKNGKMQDYLIKLIYNGGMKEFMESYSPEQLKTLVQTACEANVIDGDQLEASSPADISFWPIHPTMEKLWQFKNLKGFMTDSSWPTDKVSLYGDACSGHAANDTIKIQNLLSSSQDYITNQDFMDYIDPNSDNLDYIYDEFSWSHCTSKGYDFSKGTWIHAPIDDGTGTASASGGASTDSNVPSTEGKIRIGAMG